jgi:isoleucyl-tRNA synthetase
LIKIRNICNLSIEEQRTKKIIGSSLEANLILELDEENLALVKDIDIAELCITSSFTLKAVKNNEIKVVAEKALGNKCPVCWKLSLQPCLRHET